MGSEAERDAALCVTSVTKRYRGNLALRGIDLLVPAGEAFGLVGANGAGKTTLIKCALDLCHFDAGRIEVFGVSSREPAARSRLAYVPERFMPPHYLRCEEFLSHMLGVAGERFDAARARAVLEELELDPAVLARPVRQLSKGMTQKLGLAWCFLMRRDLYVLDEPMSGLDPAARVAVKSVLHRLKREGRTLLFTSHVLADVEELCGAIAILERGTVRFRGTPAMLCERYGEPRLERAFIRCVREAVPQNHAGK